MLYMLDDRELNDPCGPVAGVPGPAQPDPQQVLANVLLALVDQLRAVDAPVARVGVEPTYCDL
jgi:hypothetical protein